jgi:predicted Fe-Mo cluster-binding NifX family protein
MKVAITSLGNNIESKVCEKFGRAPYFVIFNTNNGDIKIINNDAANASGGAGPKAAEIIIRNEAEVILTGNVGNNALTALERAGVKIIKGLSESSTISQIIKEYNQGTFN